MTTQAQILDIPLEFEFEGKVYKVSRTVTFEMEGALADWVYQSACDRLERQRQVARARGGRGMNQTQYERMVDRIADNLSIGRYDWEGDLTSAAMNQLPGNKMMMLMRFQRFDPTVKMELINKIYGNQKKALELSGLLNPPPEAAGEDEEESQETSAADAG